MTDNQEDPRMIAALHAASELDNDGVGKLINHLTTLLEDRKRDDGLLSIMAGLQSCVCFRDECVDDDKMRKVLLAWREKIIEANQRKP